MTTLAAPIQARRSPDLATASAGHLPTLDGVRGVAILLILGHHLLAPIGSLRFRATFVDSLWIGVDLFFVLSGFLITRILLAARDKPRCFRNFYLRRALRIFPLYYAFLAALGLAAWLSPAAIDHEGAITRSLPWVAGYATNIFIALRAEFLTPLLNPLWSLAIEEHFYLLWPLLIFLLPRRALIAACIGLIVAPLLLRLAFASSLPSGTLHTLTPFRIDTLAAGSLVAVLMERGPWPAWAAKLLAAILTLTLLLLGLIWIRGGGLQWNNSIMQPGLYSILAIFFAALLAAMLQPGLAPEAGRLLSHPVLRFFGTYSYSLYLVNVPALILAGLIVDATPLAETRIGPMARSLLGLGLAVALAMATWHLLEKHCLRLKSRFT